MDPLAVSEARDRRYMEVALHKKGFIREFEGSWQVSEEPTGGVRVRHTLALRPAQSKFSFLVRSLRIASPPTTQESTMSDQMQRSKDADHDGRNNAFHMAAASPACPRRGHARSRG